MRNRLSILILRHTFFYVCEEEFEENYGQDFNDENFSEDFSEIFSEDFSKNFAKDFYGKFGLDEFTVFIYAIMSGNLELVKFFEKDKLIAEEYLFAATHKKYYNEEIALYLYEVGNEFYYISHGKHISETFYRLCEDDDRLVKFYDEEDRLKNIIRESNIYHYGNVAFFTENKDFWLGIVNQDIELVKKHKNESIDPLELTFELMDKNLSFIMEVIELFDIGFQMVLRAVYNENSKVVKAILEKHPEYFCMEETLKFNKSKYSGVFERFSHNLASFTRGNDMMINLISECFLNSVGPTVEEKNCFQASFRTFSLLSAKMNKI